MSYNPYRPDGLWEYEMFTEVLTSTRYPEKKKFVIIQSNDHLLVGTAQVYDRQLARIIDKAARNLLQRASDQGWEPVDAVDANSLWTKGRVRYKEAPDSKDSAVGRRKIELTTIHIFCRRPIQQRSSLVVELSTESNPALKHLEMEDDIPLA